MNFPEIINKLDTAFVLESIIGLAGLILFIYWVFKSSFGKNSLIDSKPRRNNMPAYIPFITLLIWIAAVVIMVSIAEVLFDYLEKWQQAFVDNLALCVGSIVLIVVIVFMVRRFFARRLKGFGLDIRTIPQDLFAGFINLLSVYPIVGLVILLTIFFGRLFAGPDYNITPHEELEILLLHSQLPLRLLVIVTVVVVVPVSEEMLFRGMFQTMIRSFVKGPWRSILISSILFSIVHPNKEHWPALFVLGMCLGYAYERKGSLFRPILIHSFFNTVSIIGTLNQ
jgi:membrane protease YdiL (CAAX protease family)